MHVLCEYRTRVLCVSPQFSAHTVLYCVQACLVCVTGGVTARPSCEARVFCDYLVCVLVRCEANEITGNHRTTHTQHNHQLHVQAAVSSQQHTLLEIRVAPIPDTTLTIWQHTHLNPPNWPYAYNAFQRAEFVYLELIAPAAMLRVIVGPKRCEEFASAAGGVRRNRDVFVGGLHLDISNSVVRLIVPTQLCTYLRLR